MGNFWEKMVNGAKSVYEGAKKFAQSVCTFFKEVVLPAVAIVVAVVIGIFLGITCPPTDPWNYA